jgi:hypothetical protein
MVYPAIDSPANYETRAVNRSLHARNTSAAEINRELLADYGQNVMKELQDNDQRWVREQMFTTKSEIVVRPSAVTDHLVHSFDQIIFERRRLIISELSSEFTQISRTVFYERDYHN